MIMLYIVDCQSKDTFLDLMLKKDVYANRRTVHDPLLDSIWKHSRIFAKILAFGESTLRPLHSYTLKSMC